MKARIAVIPFAGRYLNTLIIDEEAVSLTQWSDTRDPAVAVAMTKMALEFFPGIVFVEPGVES
jgi:hypothetical protein